MESNAMPHVYVTLAEHRCAPANKDDQSMPNVEKSCDAANEMDQTRLLISYDGQWVEDPNMGEQYVDQRAIGMVVSRSLSYEGLVQIINSIVRYNRDIYHVKLQAITMGSEITCRIDILDDNGVQFLLKEGNVMPHVYVTIQRRCAAATNVEEANQNVATNAEENKRQKKLYEAVSNKDWDAVKQELFRSRDEDSVEDGDEDYEESLLASISMNGNNILHLVVQSGSKEPLDEILDRYKSLNLRNTNAQGNTVLHEAAVNGNHEATKLLVRGNEWLIQWVNYSWETSLYTAAAFGNTQIVKFLASQPGQIVTSEESNKPELKFIHRYNGAGASILHAAIQGNHFGTALELLKLDEELAQLKDVEYEANGLFHLANSPFALLNGHRMGMWSKLLYCCIPVGYGYNDDADNIEAKNEDEESGLKQVPFRIYLLFWQLINRVCPVARKTWKEKRSRKFACELARELVEKDTSWSQDISEQIPSYGPAQNVKYESPLFAAIRTGNAELVKLILEEHPQAVELVNHKRQNILHVAAMYRQKEIFDFVLTKEIQKIRLARQIDAEGRTILHTVADTKYHRGGTSSGPAYQLQEELEWFRRVEEITPSYYIMLPVPGEERKTAMDIFKETHKDQHKQAQQWIKETSQSCSAVAVLVATVVFAAAFTVPGGTNDNNGLPILLNSPFFFVFTLTDIVSLSCSLTAVVTFLSIITSPFELEDFRITLPRRLKFGFALLFISVVTTMLAFTFTIFLVIRLEDRQRWTMTLIFCAAFFPPITTLSEVSHEQSPSM